MNFLLFVNDCFYYFVVCTHYLKEGVKSHEQCHILIVIVHVTLHGSKLQQLHELRCQVFFYFVVVDFFM